MKKSKNLINFSKLTSDHYLLFFIFSTNQIAQLRFEQFQKNTNLINLETLPTPPSRLFYYLLDSHRELPGDHKIVADDAFCSSEDFEKVRL